MTPTGSDFPEPDGAPASGWWSFGLEPDEVERPHVVVTLDTRTGAASFSGPYRTAISALCAADIEYQVDRDQGGHGELTFHVAALHTPIGVEEGDTASVSESTVTPTHPARPLAQAIVLLTMVVERAIRRPARLAAGTLVITAAPWLPDLADGRARRGRPQLHRLLHGREER
jgi:hypothetical protein